MSYPTRVTWLFPAPLLLLLLPAARLAAQVPDSDVVRLEQRVGALQAQLDSLKAELEALRGAPASAGDASRVGSPAVAQFTPDARTKTANCTAHQELPDHECTPGAIMTTDLGTICNTSTKGRRDVTPAIERAAYASYGVSYPQPQGTIELDHLISLELGGANSVENLWPQFAEPKPGFHEKDLVENELHKRVCAGELPLGEAQRIISTDWLSYYRTSMPHAQP